MTTGKSVDLIEPEPEYKRKQNIRNGSLIFRVKYK
jgi:hypothetical protein